jgi:hypothetical protein
VSSRCPAPLGHELLTDYWFGDASAADAESVEEHLLGCGECSGRLRQLLAIGEAVRRLAHRGAFELVVARSFVDDAARRGLRVREYRVPSGGSVHCTVAPEDDLLVSRLQGDFRGIARLDLVAQVEDLPEHRVEDIPVDPSAPEILVSGAMPALRALGPCVVRMRLVAPEPDGDRLVGEYTFHHTPHAR